MALEEHLAAWVGAWPPPEPGRLSVVATPTRLEPGWDGAVRPALGVLAADGSGVLAVQPGMPDGVFDSVAAAADALGARVWEAAFRWCSSVDGVPSALGDAGEWVDSEDPLLPDWLRPFNGGVLALFEDGRYVAGVGIKRHDDFGHELAVGTEPAAQGRGLARTLVATAARRVLRGGAVATYLHDFRNTASAKVADAAGFPDHGWRALGTTPD